MAAEAVIGRVQRTHEASDLPDAVFATLAPVAVGQLLAGLEGLAGLKEYGAHGLLRGRSDRGSGASPSTVMSRALDSASSAAIIHSLNIVGSVVVLAGRRRRSQQTLGIGLILIANQLFQRRNPYGRDGSDQMSGVIAGYRIVTSCIADRDQGDRLFLQAVNAQTAVAYTASGVAKLLSRSWLSGDALGDVLATDIYGNTAIARFINRRPLLGRIASRSTVLWECAFPLIYVIPSSAVPPTLAAVKLFHVAVAVTMGLPRFLWGFSASHAAVNWSTRTGSP